MKASEIEAGVLYYKNLKTGCRSRRVVSINRIGENDCVNYWDWSRGANPNSWSGEWQMTLRAFARWAEG